MEATPDRNVVVSEAVKSLKRILQEPVDPELLQHIRNGTGNPQACLRFLAGRAEKQALLAWFDAQDVNAARQWFGEAGRLRREAYEISANTLGPLGSSWELMCPLLSNNEPLIDWYAHFEGNYDSERVQAPQTFDFLAYQTIVALRGDWASLDARCDAVLADPPQSAEAQKYLADHRVYRALARGDEAALQLAMQQLLDPTLVRSRSNDEGAYTRDLISTPAVIYAKLAWRRGMRIAVASPLVPDAWLPLDAATSMASPYGV